MMALDEKGLGTYHEILGNHVSDKKSLRQKKTEDQKDETFDFFIGRFKSDNLYHLLGYRPHDLAYLFPAAHESTGDHGIVTLPDGKSSLASLVRGEILTVKPTLPNAKPYKIVYLRQN